MTSYQNPSGDEIYRPVPESPPQQGFVPYGTQSPYGQAPVVINNTGPTKPTSGMSVASLVLGCVGLIISWWTFGIPSILGAIFGVVGLKQTTANPEIQGRGMAIAGLITSLAAIAIFLLGILLIVIMGVGAGVSGY
jgi:Domain of unknown function (DUF4190)